MLPVFMCNIHWNPGTTHPVNPWAIIGYNMVVNLCMLQLSLLCDLIRLDPQTVKPWVKKAPGTINMHERGDTMSGPTNTNH